MTRAYDELGEAEQVEVLRGVALRAAAAFGLEVAGMALALHGYNTTFRVDVRDGRRLALRVGTNSHSTPEHAVDQLLAFVDAGATDVNVALRAPWDEEALDAYLDQVVPAVRAAVGARS